MSTPKQDQFLDGPLDDYLTDKSKGNNSGNYRRNAECVVGDWLSWTNDDRSTFTAFNNLSTSLSYAVDWTDTFLADFKKLRQ